MHLSRELGARWHWHNAQGQPKDMAARTLLLKLERAGYVRRPARRGPSPNGRRNRDVAPIALPAEPIRGALRDLFACASFSESTFANFKAVCSRRLAPPPPSWESMKPACAPLVPCTGCTPSRRGC